MILLVRAYGDSVTTHALIDLNDRELGGLRTIRDQIREIHQTNSDLLEWRLHTTVTFGRVDPVHAWTRAHGHREDGARVEAVWLDAPPPGDAFQTEEAHDQRLVASPWEVRWQGVGRRYGVLVQTLDVRWAKLFGEEPL